MKNKILVFDIETIPDVGSAKNLLDVQNVLGDQEIRQQLIDYHQTNYANPFPRQVFHQIACISYVDATMEKFDNLTIIRANHIKSAGEIDAKEEEIVTKFCEYCQKYNPQIISFNGRTFDMPVIRYRSMKYGISCPWMYNENRDYNKKNYSYRYSNDHLDLLEFFSDYGLSSRIKMSEVCSLFDIPCKYLVDGSNVLDMYNDGKLDEIRNYCEIDAVITFILYLISCLHKGIIDNDGYNESILILKNLSQKDHIVDFFNRFDEMKNNKFVN
jgi:predicted PolB exonuclease-like 3'-5' exonuclease